MEGRQAFFFQLKSYENAITTETACLKKVKISL
jgi:hypothetical protein